ncbi:MAG: ChaN family lipoprotein [Cyclobacteriaceae bacterium]
MTNAGWILSWVVMVSLVTDKPAYRVFNQAGQSVAYNSMIQELAEADVVLFGELHNDALVHWLELQVAQDLYNQDSNLVLGFEMLETDNQLLVDEYLAGTIEERHFTQEAKLWDNYATDYQPLLTLAQEKNIPVVATNIPRRYASLVSREGISQLDSLSDEAKKWIAPLPIQIDMELPGYQNMLSMMGGMQGHGNMSGENMVQAQAIKDATMAHFIQHKLPEGSSFLHFNGSYHSDNFEGIGWYLKQQQPELTIKTISCIELPSLDSLSEDAKGLADFVIVTPTDMTKTY